MKNNFDNINEMVELIQDELPKREYDENFNCKKCSELETSETHIDINLSNNGEGNIKTTSIASLLAKRNKRF